MALTFRPEDPSMWLTRPLGNWEWQVIMDYPAPGRTRCTCLHLTHLESTNEINIDLFRQAVARMVYREPHFRADVDLKKQPECWALANDFSSVFTYEDKRELGWAGVADAWERAEEEANNPWDYGSGKPLYRCTLIRIVGGYCILNCYHHAAGDGTSGMLAAMGILDFYSDLLDGNSSYPDPHPPKPSIEVLAQQHGREKDPILAKMAKVKADRAANYKTQLCFDLDEEKANFKLETPLNKTLWREGSPAALKDLIVRCHKEGVTIGSLALAACYMSQAVAHCLVQGQSHEAYTGLASQPVDLPVNMRVRVDPPIGDAYAGFLITFITSWAEVDKGTKLWDLAHKIHRQVHQELIYEKQHLLYLEAKEAFETGETTASLARSVAPHNGSDVLFSNMRNYKGPTQLRWGGKVRATHFLGSYWAPFFSNNVLLFQSQGDIMTYNIVYSPGENNKRTADNLIEAFHQAMEAAGNADNNYGFEDLFLATKK